METVGRNGCTPHDSPRQARNIGVDSKYLPLSNLVSFIFNRIGSALHAVDFIRIRVLFAATGAKPRGLGNHDFHNRYEPARNRLLAPPRHLSLFALFSSSFRSSPLDPSFPRCHNFLAAYFPGGERSSENFDQLNLWTDSSRLSRRFRDYDLLRSTMINERGQKSIFSTLVERPWWIIHVKMKIIGRVEFEGIREWEKKIRSWISFIQVSY